MTGLLFTTLLLLEQTGRKTKNALALGILIGLAALTKGVYLLFLLLIPIALVLFSKASTARDRSWSSGLTVTLAAVMVIAPWTVRNAFVSDRFVPVHILVGVNLAVGDHLTEELTDSPFAYGPIIDRFEYPLLDGQPFDMMTNTATRTVDYDRSLMVRSVDRYRDHPLFLAKKMSLQLLTFWALGSRLEITLVLGLLQSVLLFGAMAGFVAIRRDEGWRAVRLVPLLLVLVFWLAHAPLYAIGRFSIVLVPTLAAYCCWWFFEVRTGDRHTMTIR